MLMNLSQIKQHFADIKENPKYHLLLIDMKDKYEQIGTDIPALTFNDYKRVYEDGDRKTYEAAYFRRREQLNINAVMCLIYPDNSLYSQRLQSIIWEVCNEYYWGLPYHVEFDKNESSFIDLFAAETACALAEIQWLLKDRLYPHINSRITAELDRRVFDSFEHRDFWWFDAVHNWSAVCGGNVAVAMMRARPELYRKLKPRFDRIMNSFLSGYDEDGMCKEGVDYWYYGFGSFLFYADMLHEFSDGRYNYFDDCKVREIAGFKNKVMLGNTCCVSFSDSYVRTFDDLAMHVLLHRRYPEIKSTILPEKAYIRHRTWLYYFRMFIYYDSINTVPHDNEMNEEVLYTTGSDQYIKRSKKYSFAVKAGNNDEPHNHNDIASFIIAYNDNQILADIGVGLYTRQYFDNNTRYSIFCNSSYGHSVPIVCGKPQSAGKQFKGSLTVYDNKVKVDYAKAYDLPDLTRMQRFFELGDNSVVLHDEFDIREVRERFVSFYKFNLLKPGLIDVNGVMLTYNHDIWDCKFKEEKHVDNNIDKSTVYICDFTTKQNCDNEGYFNLNILFS